MTLTTSTDLLDRAESSTPGGVHSNVRLAGPRTFIARAAGARLWDVDGKDYVDHLLGQGPNFLGHAPAPVLDAVDRASRDGIIFGGQHRLELEAAETLLSTIGWADMVRFTVTGTEAVQAAIRLARAHTGRSRILRFEGQYHGWLDNVLLAPTNGRWGPASAGQLRGDLDHTIVIPWNDTSAVDAAFKLYGDDIAAIITEPAMINAGAIPPQPGYLEHLRRTTTDHDALLIFDEVITGFRLALGGGAEAFQITPDLATYGKAMAGGVPVAAFAGRGDIMERIVTSGVNHSGTLNGNAIGSAAVIATLAQLRDNPPYERIHDHGTTLMRQLPRIAADHGYTLNVHGFPAAFHLSFGAAAVSDWRSLQQLDLAQYDRFSHHLVDHGIWVTGRGIWYTSAAHGPQELADALERFETAIATWTAATS
ncbi:aspartate aminotransferase family protein [Jiangella gansuensis]|uniref:aspartate aminotransferase family protein n=1 Tax=Jiangella gansuensis TaxID=281473 RepID=UPI0004B2A0AE|nr:aspartate aminotransferase family protein [Jiangella gansuensis]